VDTLVNMLVLPHVLEVALEFFIDWEVSEIKISIVLHNVLRISQAMKILEGSIDFLLHFFIVLSILSLLLLPHLNSLSGFHVL